MRSKSGPQSSAEEHVREIRQATRKRYSSEEKIRIVLEGLRGEYSIAELCRREGIVDFVRCRLSCELKLPWSAWVWLMMTAGLVNSKNVDL